MDSVVLAHLCHKAGLNFDLCHVNYHLRAEESDLDEAFVSQLAKELSVQSYTKQADLSTYDGNIQLEARNQRYQWFQQILDKHGHHFIITAHHLDDVAETFLFNVGRGTGIDGALSIPDKNDKILRPLLSFSKEEIQHFAKEYQITYREDKSNLTDKYARNYLRHHVIPALKKQNPNFLKGLQKTISHLKATADFSKQSQDELLHKGMEEQSVHKTILDAKTITQSLHPKDLAYQWLHPYDFTGKQVEDFFSTSVWQNGATLLSPDWTLIYDRERFILSRKKQKLASKISFNLALIRTVNFNGQVFRFEFVDNYPMDNIPAGTAYFEANDLEYLTLRYWQKGDAFQPSGMSGKSKKVKKYFSDEKFSVDQKHLTPILVHGSEIMWIVGSRQDERYICKADSVKYLKVSISSA